LVTEPAKPVVRRFGALVVEISRDGISLRGYKRRKRFKATWADVARLCARSTPETAKGGWTAAEWEHALETICTRK